MKLATLTDQGKEKAALAVSAGFVLVEKINSKFNTSWPTDTFNIITSSLEEMKAWYNLEGKASVEQFDNKDIILRDNAIFAPLYRVPRKIWCIGLNYRAHAQHLAADSSGEEPVSFMKPDTAIIGHGDYIKIPHQSEITTAEAELGLIISKKCKDVSRENWLDVVAGFTTIIDVTAEDILKRNPRFLTRSKSFDTFFSFGPVFITADEFTDIKTHKVQTVLNGTVCGENYVSEMAFSIDTLVEFHSKVLTFLPGDVISTGTPKACQIKDGDKVECRIDGFEPLINYVRDLKI